MSSVGLTAAGLRLMALDPIFQWFQECIRVGVSRLLHDGNAHDAREAILRFSMPTCP